MLRVPIPALYVEITRIMSRLPVRSALTTGQYHALPQAPAGLTLPSSLNANLFRPGFSGSNTSS